MTRTAKSKVRQTHPRRRQTDVNPLFAVGGKLVTLDEIEAAARYEIKHGTFLDGEHEELISLIPSLCMQIRVEARQVSDKGSKHG